MNAKVELHHKIELISYGASVAILPCELHQIPYLPDVLSVIPRRNEITLRKDGFLTTLYFSMHEGIGVIRRGKYFWIFKPIYGNVPNEDTDVSTLHITASGYEDENGTMWLTDMYIDPERIPRYQRLTYSQHKSLTIALANLIIALIVSSLTVFYGIGFLWIPLLISLLMLPVIWRLHMCLWISDAPDEAFQGLQTLEGEGRKSSVQDNS